MKGRYRIAEELITTRNHLKNVFSNDGVVRKEATKKYGVVCLIDRIRHLMVKLQFPQAEFTPLLIKQLLKCCNCLLKHKDMFYPYRIEKVVNQITSSITEQGIIKEESCDVIFDKLYGKQEKCLVQHELVLLEIVT